MLSKKDIKFIRALGSAKERKSRRLFVAEGQKAVREFIKEGWRVQSIYSAFELDFDGLELEKISPKELERISQLKNPKDVLAVVQMPEGMLPKYFTENTLLCESLSDPGNMGTIIRIADWFGIRSIVCSEDSVDVYNPKVVQASMGSLARVNVYYSRLTEVIANNTLPVLVTHLNGEDIYQCDLPESAFIVMGNEARGVSEELLRSATQQVKIPGDGKAESLNVAVSTGIVCSELFRRSALKGK